MNLLRFVIFLMASVVFAGSLVLAALLTPALNNWMGLVGGAVIGFGIAVPVAIVVSNKISGGNTA